MSRKSTDAVLIVGNTLASPDLRYAAGFRTSDPIVFARVGGRSHLVVSRMDKAWAQLRAPGVTVWSPEELGLSPAARRRLSNWAAALLRRLGARRARVPATFPLGVSRRLERAGFRLAVAAAGVFPGRVVKRADEVAKIRRAQRASVAAMRAAWRLIGEARVDARGRLRLGGRPLTAEAVRAAINRTLLDRACAGGEPIVACGEASANPHATGRGPLRAGEPIVIDIFPQHEPSGYWGDLTRTVCKGRPKPGLAKLHAAVVAAQRAARGAVRAGVSGGRVHACAARELERRGYRTETIAGRPAGFIHSTGHGVGVEIHEAPSVAAGAGRLRAGSVVTVEPGLYYPGLGGVRIEDTVVVTRAGAERLAACPYRLCIP